jgi:Telomeric single stranded DNA binding POT1/CDC13
VSMEAEFEKAIHHAPADERAIGEDAGTDEVTEEQVFEEQHQRTVRKEGHEEEDRERQRETLDEARGSFFEETLTREQMLLHGSNGTTVAKDDSEKPVEEPQRLLDPEGSASNKSKVGQDEISQNEDSLDVDEEHQLDREEILADVQSHKQGIADTAKEAIEMGEEPLENHENEMRSLDTPTETSLIETPAIEAAVELEAATQEALAIPNVEFNTDVGMATEAALEAARNLAPSSKAEISETVLPSADPIDEAEKIGELELAADEEADGVVGVYMPEDDEEILNAMKHDADEDAEAEGPVEDEDPMEVEEPCVREKSEDALEFLEAMEVDEDITTSIAKPAEPLQSLGEIKRIPSSAELLHSTGSKQGFSQENKQLQTPDATQNTQQAAKFAQQSSSLERPTDHSPFALKEFDLVPPPPLTTFSSQLSVAESFREARSQSARNSPAKTDPPASVLPSAFSVVSKRRTRSQKLTGEEGKDDDQISSSIESVKASKSTAEQFSDSVPTEPAQSPARLRRKTRFQEKAEEEEQLANREAMAAGFGLLQEKGTINEPEPDHALSDPAQSLRSTRSKQVVEKAESPQVNISQLSQAPETEGDVEDAGAIVSGQRAKKAVQERSGRRKRKSISVLPVDEDDIPTSSPNPLASNFITSHAEFPPLLNLRTTFHAQSLVDSLAIVSNTSDAQRSKAGLKDYYIDIRIVDPSLYPEGADEKGDTRSVGVNIFRPYANALPTLSVGDGVLLRDFEVKSEKGELMLISTKVSSWAVFENGGRVVMSGPPVELGPQETERVEDLKTWWKSLPASHEKTSGEDLEVAFTEDSEKGMTRAQSRTRTSQAQQEEETIAVHPRAAHELETLQEEAHEILGEEADLLHHQDHETRSGRRMHTLKTPNSESADEEIISRKSPAPHSTEAERLKEEAHQILGVEADLLHHQAHETRSGLRTGSQESQRTLRKHSRHPSDISVATSTTGVVSRALRNQRVSLEEPDAEVPESPSTDVKRATRSKTKNKEETVFEPVSPVPKRGLRSKNNNKDEEESVPTTPTRSTRAKASHKKKSPKGLGLKYSVT